MLNMTNMNPRATYEALIISKLNSWGYAYEKIENNTVLKNIYDLYKNGEYIDCDNEIYLNYAAIYAEYGEKNNSLSEKYHLMAIDKGNVCSIHNLALFYERQDKSDALDSCEKYLLMSIEKGVVLSMHHLARLYDGQSKYDLAEKYYLMAIEKGYVESMYELAYLYRDFKKYELSKHYFIMGARNYHERSTKKINKILTNHFKLDDFIKSLDILNDHNKEILNDVLKSIENKRQMILI